MSTSPGILPNARHCHINDVVTAQQNDNKIIASPDTGTGKLPQSEEIAFRENTRERAGADGQQGKRGERWQKERPRLFAIHDR